MRFVEKFEVYTRTIDGCLNLLGTFDTYDDAYEAAILQASAKLPQETVTCFEIHKLYANVPVWTSATPTPKRGD